MGQHGHRNMFRLTGMPGWMRFGYSPGWGGMPPCAQYLSETGQLDQAIDWFQQQTGTEPQQLQQQPQRQQPQQSTVPAGQFQPMQPPQPQVSKEQEIQVLERQAQSLEQQIDQIRERIKQLKE